MSLMLSATAEELEGVEAIQFLLSLTGHKEPKWISLKKWRSFYDNEREITINTYRQMKEEENAKEKETANAGLQTQNASSDSGDEGRGTGGDGLVE